MRSLTRFTAIGGLCAIVGLTACGGGNPTNPPLGDGGTRDQWLGDGRPTSGEEFLHATLTYEGRTYAININQRECRRDGLVCIQCILERDHRGDNILDIQAFYSQERQAEGSVVLITAGSYHGPDRYPTAVATIRAPTPGGRVTNLFQSLETDLDRGVVVDEELPGNRLSFHFEHHGLCPRLGKGGDCQGPATGQLQGSGICFIFRRMD